MSDSYTLAALRGLGSMEGDDSYTSAALRGGSYTDAALRGGSYTNAALRGGKFDKESQEFMAHLRSLRPTKTKGGKKLKGGIAFSTIAAALGLIPTAIKGAHAIYKWIKGSGLLKSKKGGRALILNPTKRSEYIQRLMDHYSGRSLSARWPYSLEKAAKHATIRKRALGSEVVKYLEDNDLLDKAIFDTEAMKKYKKQARSALLKKHEISEDGLVLPDLLSDEPVPIPTPPLSSRRRKPITTPPPSSRSRKPRNSKTGSTRTRGVGKRELKNLRNPFGLPNGKI